MTSLAKPAAVLFQHLTPTGLRLPRTLSFDSWAKLGAILGRTGRAIQWAAGDWLAYGEDRYGEKYSQAMEATGLDHATLANYATVARKIPHSRRRESLPFSHHQVVAALSEAAQERWLTKAERDGLTRAQLRSALVAAGEIEARKALTQEGCPPHKCVACGVAWNGNGQ